MHATNNTEKHSINSNEKWPNNTVLIVGDSTIRGLIEKRLSNDNSIKVRGFSGAKINDFYNYLLPLFKKEPARVILHCGTNDGNDKTPE